MDNLKLSSIRNEQSSKETLLLGHIYREVATVYVRCSITASFASNAARYHRNEALVDRNPGRANHWIETRIRYTMSPFPYSSRICISATSGVSIYYSIQFLLIDKESTSASSFTFQHDISQSRSARGRDKERRGTKKGGKRWDGLKSGAAKGRANSMKWHALPWSVREKSSSTRLRAPYFPISTSTLFKGRREPPRWILRAPYERVKNPDFCSRHRLEKSSARVYRRIWRPVWTPLSLSTTSTDTSQSRVRWERMVADKRLKRSSRGEFGEENLREKKSLSKESCTYWQLVLLFSYKVIFILDRIRFSLPSQ